MASDGSLSITPEWAKGIIGVEGRGSWSVEQARVCFADLNDLVGDLRARNGAARVLVDLRAMERQAPEVVDIIRAATAAIYTVEDRVALLLATSLQREQVDDITRTLNATMFEDAFAALRWLKAG